MIVAVVAQQHAIEAVNMAVDIIVMEFVVMVVTEHVEKRVKLLVEELAKMVVITNYTETDY